MPKFFRFDYAIRTPEGEIADSSEGSDPLWFVEGDGRMIPGLERAVRTRGAGDEFDVTIGPDEAYGWPQRALIRTISADQINADVEAIEPGMIFQVGSGAETEVIKIVAVEADGVTVDGNHPLAGVTFHFEIKVLEARDATKDEIELANLQ